MGATPGMSTDNSREHKTATPREGDWTKPQALAIPKEGYFTPEQGRYGTIFPKTPAGYGFTVIARIIPGREPVFYEGYSSRPEHEPGLFSHPGLQTERRNAPATGARR